jgi:hypothetical protein
MHFVEMECTYKSLLVEKVSHGAVDELGLGLNDNLDQATEKVEQVTEEIICLSPEIGMAYWE